MGFIVHELEQNTQEWLDFRRNKIGASDVAGIMGLSPWKTRLSLWEDKVFEKSQPTSSAMQRGKDLEQIARDKLNTLSDLGNETAFEPIVIQHDFFSYIIASVDCFAYDFNGKPIAIEIKAPGLTDHLTALEGKIPRHYMPQLQQTMFILDIDYMGYYSFDGQEGHLIWVERDAVFIHEMLIAINIFQASVIDFRPPEPTDRDWVEETDSSRIAMLNEYLEDCKAIEALEKSKDAKKSQLIDGLHPRTKIGDVKIQRVIRKGIVQYEKIEALQNVDLESFRKPPTESWRIS